MNTRPKTQLFALGGIVGPVIFITGWVLLEMTWPGYSPMSQAVSELAHLGAPTHSAMTVVFALFGVFICLYSLPLRSWLGNSTAIGALSAGIASICLASAPLGTPTTNAVHFTFAAIAYLAISCGPLFGAGKLPGYQRFAALVLGAVTAGVLIISVLGPRSVEGLFQRIGLTLGDIWFMATAAALLGPFTPLPRGTHHIFHRGETQ